MSDNASPALPVSIEGQAFWDAAHEGRLLIKACTSCGQSFWYPRAICPFCLSGDTEWRAASGAGTIYSRTVLRGAKPPYTIALVNLDEGPTMLANIVGDGALETEIGARVQACFVDDGSGSKVPAFSLAHPFGA